VSSNQRVLARVSSSSTGHVMECGKLSSQHW